MMKEAILAILACAILLFGCAGSEPQAAPSGGNTGGAGNVPTGASGGNPPTGGDNGATPPPSTMPPLDARGELSDLYNRQKTAEFLVSYDVTTSMSAGVTKMDQYLKGMSKIRIDTKSQGVDSRAYMLSDILYSCMMQGGAWKCYKMDVPLNMSELASADFSKNLDTYTIVKDGSMSVAGTSAACYKLTEISTGHESRSCFSAEGVPLYVKSTATNPSTGTFTSELTATNYGTSVPDSVFELPAVAETLPSFGGQMGGTVDPCAYCDYLDGADKADCLASCNQ